MPQYTDSTGLTWNYTESGGNATIGKGSVSSATTLGTRLSGAITIPSTLGGYPVTGISILAFTSCSSLTSLDLSGTQVETIANYVFLQCSSLTSIHFPDSVITIGASAFYGCSSLTSIHFPDSVTTIGVSAFYGCSSLTSIDLGNSLTSIANESFFDCTSLTSLDLSGTQVETIGQYAFSNCSSLTSVDLGNSLTSIGLRAFFQCTSLTSVDFGNSVTSIGNHAFYQCSKITSIIIPDSVITIGDYAFYQCGLTSIDLGNSLTTIGDSGFQQCYSLTSITIPDSVTSIGSIAFYGIGSSSTFFVKNVDPNDAYTMTTLQNTIIGKITGTVTYEQWVEPNYAPNTPTLSDISCNENTNTPYTATVSATDDNGDILTFDLSGADAADFTLSGTDLSGNAVLSAKAVFDFETKATYNITITASDGSLNTSADFTITVNNVVVTASDLYNANVEGATLKATADNEGITTQQLLATGYTIEQIVAAGFQIWNYTLDANNNATIGTGVAWDVGNATTLGTSLSGAITIPSTIDGYTVTGIGQYAFMRCYELETIDLSGTQVTSIDYRAFSQCTSLTSMTIPDSVTTIGSEAFSRCTSLTSYSVDANNNSFSDINGVLFNKNQSTLIQYPMNNTATSYTIPHSVTTIGQNAFYNCTSLTSIDLSGTQVETIGEYAFYGCSNLETIINIPNSLTTIGEYAFQSCSSLTSIIIPVSVTTIGDYAFGSCSSLTSITVDANNNSFSSDINGALFDKDQSTLLQYPVGNTATSYALPDSVTTIGNNTFSGCTSLTSIDLGNLVTTIGNYAFSSCSSLTSITIPDSVTTIGTNAFGWSWGPIGPSVIVYVKDVDPNDNYTMSTLQNTMSGKISSGNGAVTYTPWVEPNYAPTTPTLFDISCNENTPYTATVSATDDNGDALTFSLSGADSADFTLTGTSLSANAEFDFETKATYNITITASDGSLNTSADFIITVNNVVETASELFNANVQGATLKTSADDVGINSQQLLDAGYTSQHLFDAGYLHSDICFVEGTPVNTDQGAVAIDKLDVSKHTIRGKPIVAVTKTIADEKHLVCIRKDALAKNVPSQDTLTTQNHTFFYNGNMVKAKHLVNKLDNVVLVKYDGCTLYNVLQDNHEKMVVNNLIAETLHPNHCIAQIYRYFAENKVSPEMQQKAIASLRKDQVNKKVTK